MQNAGNRQRAALLACVLAGVCLSAAAQTAAPAGALPAGAAAPSTSNPRVVEACQQALREGRVDAACDNASYGTELQRLRAEALRSNNPTLMGLVGDAYANPRSPLAEPGEAYRWTLMAAVRGDPRAMERLTDMYRHGEGVPRDRVRAFGYARATTRLAVPGSATAVRAERAVGELGAELSAQELGLAERFAEQMMGRLSGAPGAAAATTPAAGERSPGGATRPEFARPWADTQMLAVPRGTAGSAQVPGMGAAQPGGAPVPWLAGDAALRAGQALPGVPSAPPAPVAPVAPHAPVEAPNAPERPGG